MVMLRWSVDLTALLLGRRRPPKWLTSTSKHSFASKFPVGEFYSYSLHMRVGVG